MQEDPLIIPETVASDSSIAAADVKEQRVDGTGSAKQAPKKRFLVRFIENSTCLVFLLGVFFLFLLVGLFVEKPYVVISPGGAEDTEPFLQIEGADFYPSDGEILLTTVREKSTPNVWEYYWAKNFHKHSRIVEYEEYFPSNQTEEESDDINLSLMVSSQELAKGVALEKLGYEDVFISGGILVRYVEEESAADGVIREIDKIESVDGLPVNDANQFVETLASYAPGDRVSIVVERFVDDSAKKMELDVVLGQNPEDETKPYLGILLIDHFEFNNSLPVDIQLNAGSIGGPSGGLAFSLAILDALTEGELLGRKRIAFTGEIWADGSVLPVGGVPQKAVAVRKSGAKVFVIPDSLGEDQYQQIEEFVGDDLIIERVGSLDEALAVVEARGGDISPIEKLGGDIDQIEAFPAANRSLLG